MRASVQMGLLAVLVLAAGIGAADIPAVVRKPTVDVYARPSFEANKVATLQRDAAVRISAQQGLWYALQVPTGFVRINDVRLDYAGTEDGDANLRVLMGGKAGAGRVTETAGVRGIDESDLKAAGLDQVQLDRLVAQRVTVADAASHAAAQGWNATEVAFAGETGGRDDSTPAPPSASTAAAAESAAGMLGSFGRKLGTVLGTASKVLPKSEQELAAEELALGPQIAGRILGVRPLWGNAAAQQRVNLVGRWLASQTSRPDLPWTFGVIDTPELNAFAAPGGYVLVTRGLYELLASDAELAAVLGHEIGHCVARDHYRVIRKQEMTAAGQEAVSREVGSGGGGAAETYARRYVEKHGAAIMLTALDRDAEYHADESSEFYLARAGTNPLALYAVLQKMAALGNASAGLAQLYKTHPPLDERLDRIDQRDHTALLPYTSRE
ncbi:MAG TPA: M48 family metalloprotease [Steroidobacteraceae bacterium]|nr:M48 family metalloprotease [Steroidobacteraceae bacterium]